MTQKRKKNFCTLKTALSICLSVPAWIFGTSAMSQQSPSRSETIEPVRMSSLDRDGSCSTRRQGGNPRILNGYFVFDGATDGNRQVDPQIAVGGGYILHATNHGLVVFDKEGQFINGVSQSCFLGGIDPKLFFDPHNQVFGFDLWDPWDDASKKPVNISVSESNDPTAAWNTYAVPAPRGRDGGGIGFSRKWIGYTFPGGPEQTFVLSLEQAKNGETATVYHFEGNLGHPVMTQDAIDDLYFFEITNRHFVIRCVSESEQSTPYVSSEIRVAHELEFVGYPPPSPQKDSDQKTASGDRNPKNIVLQNGSLWFSHTVNCRGRAAVQWHQISLDGERIQSGRIEDDESSYIQTTIAVNREGDVLVGYQETGPNLFISPRMAFRRGGDPLGELRESISLGEGQAATAGLAWGDYSGSVVDGDDQLTLWTIQSIADDEGKGDTVIARVPIDE